MFRGFRSLSVLATLALGACAVDVSSPSVDLKPAQVTTTSADGIKTVTERIPIPGDVTIGIPCVNGGNGENLSVSGSVGVVVVLRQAAAGNLNGLLKVDWNGLRLIGQTTGARYTMSGGITLKGNGDFTDLGPTTVDPVTGAQSFLVTIRQRVSAAGQRSAFIDVRLKVTQDVNGNTRAMVLQTRGACSDLGPLPPLG